MHKMCTVASENGDVQCRNAANSGTQCQTKGGGGSAKIGFYIFSFSPVFFKELYWKKVWYYGNSVKLKVIIVGSKYLFNFTSFF